MWHWSWLQWPENWLGHPPPPMEGVRMATSWSVVTGEMFGEQHRVLRVSARGRLQQEAWQVPTVVAGVRRHGAGLCCRWRVPKSQSRCISEISWGEPSAATLPAFFVWASAVSEDDGVRWVTGQFWAIGSRRVAQIRFDRVRCRRVLRRHANKARRRM